MGEQDNISEQSCGKCRQDIDHRFEVIQRDDNSQDSDIRELTIISSKLTVIVDELRESNQRLECRVTKLEDGKALQPKFWQMPWFDWAMKGIIIICIMIVAAAIGQNLDNIKPLLSQ